MKILKYNFCPEEGILFPVEMDWNEANEEIAKREAHNGEYTIEDDEQADRILKREA